MLTPVDVPAISAFEYQLSAVAEPSAPSWVLTFPPTDYGRTQTAPVRIDEMSFSFRLVSRASAAIDSALQIARLQHLQSDWNTYGADAPNQVSISAAELFLSVLADSGLFPAFTTASPEGGVTFTFTRSGRHAAIEIHNDGTAVGVISRPDSLPDVWEFDPSAESAAHSAARVAAFLAP